MATIRVYFDETNGESFPPLCARCGQESDTEVRKLFAWVPEWVIIIILAGLLPWLIVVAVTRKTKRVTLPLCSRHRNHWLNRALILYLGLLFWIAAVIAAIVVADQLPKDATTPVILFFVIGIFVWLVTVAILYNRAIRAAVITHDRIDLIGISRRFADEWEALRPPVAPVVRRRRRPALRNESDDTASASPI